MSAEFAACGAAILSALAAMAPPPGKEGEQPGILSFLPMMIMVGVIFYVLMLRPQQKKQQEQKQMLDSLKKGDHVVTSGGIHGVVALIKENVVAVKVADNVKIDFSKSAIAAVTKKAEEAADAGVPAGGRGDPGH